MTVTINVNQHRPLSIKGLRTRTYTSRLTRMKRLDTKSAKFQAFLFSYRSDGLKVFARVNVPMGESPPSGFPVLVFAHGYSPNPLDPEYFQRPYYEAWINAYTEAGFLVVMPGYRGHGIVNGENADGLECFTTYAELCLTSPFYAVDVLNLLAGLPNSVAALDGKNMFLAAHSMGSDVALAVLAVTGVFKAASLWAGVCADVQDVVAFYTHDALTENKSETLFEAAWAQVTAATQGEPFFFNNVNDGNGYYFLENIHTPLILHQGTGDQAVSPDWSVKLHEKLKELGRESALYLYEGDDHELSLNAGHQTALARDVAFFRAHFNSE